MKRNEIWLVNLDPTIGSEIKKTRPAIIVNDDKIGILPLKVIVPITDWNPKYSIAPWMVNLKPDSQNNLTKESAADTFQVRSVSEKRLVRRIGNLSQKKMNEISVALSKVLKI